MSESEEDTGVLMVLLERVKDFKIPNALALKVKVDSGEMLSDYDTDMLERIIVDLEKVKPRLARHPEYQILYERLAHLYKEISDKALENELKSD